MPNDIDRSLLDRLQALRGASEPPESSPKISVDTIERAKTPTREDTLAARLKSLRSQDDSPQANTADSPSPAAARQQRATTEPPRTSNDDYDVDAAFQTDDKDLEDLLADVGGDEPNFASVAEPDDAKVKALLEELADSIPKDSAEKNERQRYEEEQEGKNDEDDDSDGEKMGKEVDDVVARYRDEIEMDKKLGLDEEKTRKEGDDEDEEAAHQISTSDDKLPSLDDLPSVPANAASDDLPSTPSDLDTLTSRLAALRTNDSESALPDVPTNAPSKEPKRLTSRTNYTDEDADSWCTVCLEDATVRCLGCDGDVYCQRCWREMHVGPMAGYDERGHKAVQFTREGKGEKKKVAIGAS
ncbi:zinc finger, FYVE domain-containing protein [Sarocladium strictum]